MRCGGWPGFLEYESMAILTRLAPASFALEGTPHILVAAILSAEFSIAIHNGSFCAQPYLRRLLGLSDEQIERAHAELRAGDRRNQPGLVRATSGCITQPRKWMRW